MAGKTKQTKSVTKAVQGEVVTPETLTTEDRAKLVEKVIELMGQGWSERKACEMAGIARSTFRTTALRQGAGDQYARALATLANEQVQQVEQTIQDMRNGTVDAMMAKVEIDTRKWFASKFLPKMYGDKVDLTTNGKDMPTPLLGGLTLPDVSSSNSNSQDTQAS